MFSAFEQHCGLVSRMVLSEQTYNKQNNAGINNTADAVLTI